ncbi:FliH/SctL family protein, partial [Serratia marcescens]|uniref:FliH/SctL family protein n=1 Tax=Serratia marcescens TaxID=615 RepID=UPI0023B81CF0
HSAGWTLRADGALSRGGCRVSGPEGELDATRESRWQALLARTRRHSRSNAPPAEPTP